MSTNDPKTKRDALIDDAMGLMDQIEESLTAEGKADPTWPQVGSLAEVVAKLWAVRNFLAGEPDSEAPIARYLARATAPDAGRLQNPHDHHRCTG